jgi:hypothetical protein
VKDLEDELGATKLKVCLLEYDFKEVEKKSEGFSPTDIPLLSETLVC